MLRVWIRTLDRQSELANAAPADALDLCFLLYRRLDCVDYAFCDLILQVEYAG